jgi:hypothetical protein
MIRGDDTKFAFRSHEKFDYKVPFTRDSMKCEYNFKYFLNEIRDALEVM